MHRTTLLILVVGKLIATVKLYAQGLDDKGDLALETLREVNKMLEDAAPKKAPDG